jgi:transposase
MAVMIGIDPHKGSHMAVALDASEGFLGELRVRSASNQVERLVAWAAPFEERTWAIEGAGGLGYLLAQQLVAAGERVVDVQPKLAARVRLLATGRRTRTIPTTPVQLRSPPCVRLRSRRFAARITPQ